MVATCYSDFHLKMVILAANFNVTKLVHIGYNIHSDAFKCSFQKNVRGKFENYMLGFSENSHISKNNKYRSSVVLSINKNVDNDSKMLISEVRG